MTTLHFNDRFQERVGGLDIPTDEVIRLWEKSHKVTRNSQEVSESVCIHIFKDDVIKHDGENQLWVLIRNQRLVTTWRRNENDNQFTNDWGMKVDKVSYQLN